MTAVIDWPWGVQIKAGEPYLDNLTAGGARSLSGRSQIVDAGTALWFVEIELTRLNVADVRAWRAFLANMRGRTNAVRLPVCEPWQPMEIGGLLPGGDRGTWDNHQPFDEMGWDYGDPAALQVTALAGANSLTLAGAADWLNALAPGTFINVGQDLHLIRRSDLQGGDLSVDVAPDFRRDHAGAELSLRPWFYGRFSADTDGRMTQDRRRYSSPRLLLEEAIDVVP